MALKSWKGLSDSGNLHWMERKGWETETDNAVHWGVKGWGVKSWTAVMSWKNMIVFTYTCIKYGIKYDLSGD